MLADVEVFCPRSVGIEPVLTYLPPSKGWYYTLRGLEDFKAKRPSARVVVNLSHSDLSFRHVKYLAAWLQVPGRNLHLFALDLSFNRIQAITWASFARLSPGCVPMFNTWNLGATICQLSSIWTLNKSPPLKVSASALQLISSAKLTGSTTNKLESFGHWPTDVLLMILRDVP